MLILFSPSVSHLPACLHASEELEEQTDEQDGVLRHEEDAHGCDPGRAGTRAGVSDVGDVALTGKAVSTNQWHILVSFIHCCEAVF